MDWITVVYIAATPYLLFVGLWLVFRHKEIPSKLNLWIPSRRARAVKVNMLTRAGRNLELIAVPDDRGIIHWNKGAYVYHPDCAAQNAKLRIPETSFIEGQPHPFLPPITVVEAEMEVEEPQENGLLLKVKRKVPTYIQNLRKTTPQKLQTYTSQEIETALNNKIVQDIITSTSTELNQIRIILFVTVGVLAASIIGDYLLWTSIGEAKTLITAQAAELAKHVSGGIPGGPR